MKLMPMLLLLLVSTLVQGQTYCSDYEFIHDTLPNVWISTKDHKGPGSHSVVSYFHNDCSYEDIAKPPAVCGVQQYLVGFASPLEWGSVGGFLRFHQMIPATKTGLTYAQGASVTTAYIGAGIWSCSAVLNDCGGIGITIPPVSLSGSNQVESFQADGVDYCPLKRSRSTAPHCDDPPCAASPLIANLSGLGPWSKDTPGSENNIYQLTDIQYGIWYDLLNTGKPQHIAWLARGSHMGVLVLPDDRNVWHTFGNYTKCANGQLCKDGFLALAYKCDDAINSGNNDGKCDKNDAAFSKLRWIVRLRDGKAKLYTMQAFGVQSFDVLAYQELTGKLHTEDSIGNTFAYKGSFDAGWKQKSGGYQSQQREIYDVILKIKK